MPLFSSTPIETGILGIWKISETVEKLLELLPKTQNLEELSRISHPQRKKEWLSARILCFQLAEKLNVSVQNIFKNKADKPFFEGSNIYFSMSHTTEFAVAILHPSREVGIDIEKISEKMKTVAPRVFDETEMTENQNIQELATIWCAKEALYKIDGEKKMDFQKQILVRKIDDQMVGFIKREKKIRKFDLFIQNLKTEYRIVFAWEN